MKREFGKTLIEEYLPRKDLTHVIDTSGAYIPGHGTPTVILFARNRAPKSEVIRAVLGIRGEPRAPDIAAEGKVWSSIVALLPKADSESDYISVVDQDRSNFGNHPWSVGGGGASDLKEKIASVANKQLSAIANEIGFGAVTREDEAYLVGQKAALRRQVPKEQIRPMIEGEVIRDWALQEPNYGIWPYSDNTLKAEGKPETVAALWPLRTNLSRRVAYGLSQLGRGLQWYEYSMFFNKRYDDAGEPVTVKRLRAGIDQPTPKGLPSMVQNLLIMVFAEHGQYAFTLHGADYEPTLKDLPDNLVLTKQDLAESAVWQKGIANASAIFGVVVNKLRTANHQNILENQIKEEVRHRLAASTDLVAELKGALKRVDQPLTCNRMRNAEYAHSLMQALDNSQGAALIEVLANVEPITNINALARSIVTAANVTQAIQDNNWQLLDTVWRSGPPEGKQIKARVCNALAADELVTALQQALRQAQADATALITRNVPPAQPEPPASTPPSTAPAAGRNVVAQSQKTGLTRQQAKALFADIESSLKQGYVLDVSYSIVRTDVAEA
jgi:hypothetical protein